MAQGLISSHKRTTCQSHRFFKDMPIVKVKEKTQLQSTRKFTRSRCSFEAKSYMYEVMEMDMANCLGKRGRRTLEECERELEMEEI